MARIFIAFLVALCVAVGALPGRAIAAQPVALTVQGGAGSRTLCLQGYGVAGNNPDDICVPIGTFDPVAHTASMLAPGAAAANLGQNPSFNSIAINVPPIFTRGGTVSASLTADFLNDVYTYGYRTAPTSNTLGGLWTLTRSGANATYVDSAGIIQPASANTWRKTYDMATKTLLGYVVEEARSNYLPNSTNANDQIGWVYTGATVAASSDLPAIYNDGSAVIAKHTITSASSGIVIGAGSVGAVAAGNYAFSIYIWVPRQFSGSAILLRVEGTGWTTGIVAADLTKRDQWQRVWVAANSAGTNNGNPTVRAYGSSNGDYFYSASWQVEAGSGLTSWIPTSGSGATRSADVIAPVSTIGVDMFSGGTLMLDATTYAGVAAVANGGVTLGDKATGGNNSVAIRASGDPDSPIFDVVAQSNNVTTGRLAGPPVSDQAKQRIVATICDKDLSISDRDGGSNITRSLPLPASLSAIWFGTPALTGTATINVRNPVVSGSMIYRSLSFTPACLSSSAAMALAESRGPFSITANVSSPGLTIPLNFIGSSIEYSNLASMNLPNVAALYTALGSNGVIRMGGSTSDYPTTLPTDAQLHNWASFVQSLGSGWSLVYGLNFQNNNPTLSAHEASVLAGDLGASRVAFQIGNEPDLYQGNGSTYGTTEAAYETNWLTFYTAVSGAVSGARFAGPDVSQSAWVGKTAGAWNSYGAYFSTFLANQHAKLAFASTHGYGGGTAYQQPSDVKGIWAFAPYESMVTSAKSIATANSVAIRETEGGSLNQSNGDTATTVGAALYNLHHMMQLAQNGWGGVNFHGGQGGGYSPQVINADGQTYSAQASFYALLVFKDLLGGQILPQTSSGPQDLPSLAVLGADGKTRVLVLNESATAQATVSVGSNGAWTTATARTLTGASMMAKAMTYGSASVASNGAFSPSSAVLPVSGGMAAVTIPPSSAVVVTLQ